MDLKSSLQLATTILLGIASACIIAKWAYRLYENKKVCKNG